MTNNSSKEVSISTCIRKKGVKSKERRLFQWEPEAIQAADGYHLPRRYTHVKRNGFPGRAVACQQRPPWRSHTIAMFCIDTSALLFTSCSFSACQHIYYQYIPRQLQTVAPFPSTPPPPTRLKRSQNEQRDKLPNFLFLFCFPFLSQPACVTTLLHLVEKKIRLRRRCL